MYTYSWALQLEVFFSIQPFFWWVKLCSEVDVFSSHEPFQFTEQCQLYSDFGSDPFYQPDPKTMAKIYDLHRTYGSNTSIISIGF